MIITYLGKQFFKIKSGETVIAFNPYKSPQNSHQRGGQGVRFGANLALVSINHPFYNDIETVTYGSVTPFVISGAGEYEVKNILIKGIDSPVNLSTTTLKECGSGKGGDCINTIYSLSLDNMKISFLGVISSSKILREAREMIESSDVLFVPINAELFPVSEAYTLAVSLLPKIIIPMDYDEGRETDIKGNLSKKAAVAKQTLKKDALEIFLKEGGEGKKKSIDKLVLKKKDLEEKEGEIIVLST